MPVPPIPVVIEPDAECRSNTDSVGSHSDVSGHTLLQTSTTTAPSSTTSTPAGSGVAAPITQVVARPHMDVVCVIDIYQSDNLAHRRKALDEVKHACLLVGANLSHIQFEKLDFGEANVVSSFYNADVVIVDLSLPVQQSTLFYHLGVRESFNMKQNILIYNDTDSEATLRLKLSCGNYCFVSYTLSDEGSSVATHPSGRSDETQVEVLHQKFKRLLQDVEIQSKSPRRCWVHPGLDLGRLIRSDEADEGTNIWVDASWNQTGMGGIGVIVESGGWGVDSFEMSFKECRSSEEVELRAVWEGIKKAIACEQVRCNIYTDCKNALQRLQEHRTASRTVANIQRAWESDVVGEGRRVEVRAVSRSNPGIRRADKIAKRCMEGE